MYTWKVFAYGQSEIPTGSNATAAGARADAIAAGTSWDVGAFNWEVYDSSGNVVDSSGGGGGGSEVKYKVDVTGQWASGFIFDTLAAAEAGLEAQRGSFPAGGSYSYTISDRTSVVKQGTVTSTAYEPDDANYYIRIHNELTNTDEPDDNTPYATLDAAKAALPGKEATLKARSATQGKYDWWILKAGQAVADGVFIWGFDGGDSGGDMGDWPLKLLIIGGIIAVAVYYLFLKGRAAPAVPALPAAPAVAAIPAPIPEAKT